MVITHELSVASTGAVTGAGITVQQGERRSHILQLTFAEPPGGTQVRLRMIMPGLPNPRIYTVPSAEVVDFTPESWPVAGTVNAELDVLDGPDVIWKSRTFNITIGKSLETASLEAIVDTGDADAVATDLAMDKTAYVNGVKLVGTATAVDTTDADAVASDIYLNKTAYVNGVKLTGTSNAIDTTDADAAATDIATGKTAYVQGAKVTGTSVAVDTTDATATAENILIGFTAYAQGAKVTGTSTAVDTSDADATAADIATGKTAYVNGVKITGTA